MIDIEYAKNFQILTDKYLETGNFEDILTEAHQFNEEAFEKTIKNANEYGEWKYYKEQCTKPFRYYDIVEIAKTLRKELKKEFTDIKFNIKTERGWETDTLYITVKPQNEKHLTPLPEYMEEYKRTYYHRHGIEHPYINDEIFEKHAKLSIDRLNEDIRLKIHEITHLFVMDNSDIMTDYFDINYVCFYKFELDGESTAGWTSI